MFFENTFVLANVREKNNPEIARPLASYGTSLFLMHLVPFTVLGFC